MIDLIRGTIVFILVMHVLVLAGVITCGRRIRIGLWRAWRWTKSTRCYNWPECRRRVFMKNGRRSLYCGECFVNPSKKRFTLGTWR